MNKRILILDEYTSNQIAAGEVVERPASVLKELVENSIDANASAIEVDITKGGIGSIRITDNGSGINHSDIEMAFERHGTSKIRNITDLDDVSTMGFRGEALPSIASISRVTLITKTADDEHGIKVKFEAGDLVASEKAARDVGTTIEIRDIFFNTPARYKFLKSNNQEARYCMDILTRLALANPNISFRMTSDRNETLRTNGDGNLLNAIYAIYGREIAKDLLEVDLVMEDFLLKGFIGSPFASRGNRQNQSLFINSRYVKYPELNSAIEKAYDTLLMKGRFPFYVLNLYVKGDNLDVNVHPTKIEVKLANLSSIYGKIVHGLRDLLFEDKKPMNAKIVKPTYIKQEPQIKEDKTLIDLFNRKLEESASLVKESKDDIYEKRPFILEESKESTYKSDEKPKLKDVITSTFEAPVSETLIDSSFSYTIIGQVMDTYIIVDKYDHILVIDQHAAHEKMYFEQMVQEYKDKSIVSQQLLLPEELVLTSLEMNEVLENISLFESLGFYIDQFGDNSIIVRTVPINIIECNVKDVFLSLLDDLKTKDEEAIDKAIYTMACKAAIKANRKLNHEEMTYIYEKLHSLENPYTCPHGRPTIVKLRRYDFDKMFKRIV